MTSILFFDTPYIEVPEMACVGNIHNIPTNDWYPHINNKYCFCQPTLSRFDDNIWQHNSYDGRELEYKKGN